MKAKSIKTKTPKSPAEIRRLAEIAKIHIGAEAIGIDTKSEAYREMLQTHGGAHSAADLEAAGRHAVLDHLYASGFKPVSRKSQGRPKNADRQGAHWRRKSRAAQLEKIEALLTVGGKSWAYADGIAKRICKVERVTWVPAGSLYKIITALRKQAQREGWDLSGECK